ncbi:hypothetical protein QYE76_063336 [Lolium multiflorum]|uniref:Uncharacterized protein n=1 Tax=Lolium multiflorum TaxID=4521 RepID=A0AAD8S4C8_LOLMU|nr:hypothetical protein QYE76_063336 [Lolium multiflorum]
MDRAQENLRPAHAVRVAPVTRTRGHEASRTPLSPPSPRSPHPNRITNPALPSHLLLYRIYHDSATARAGTPNSKPHPATATEMATTGDDHVTAAGEETPLRKPEQAAETTELSAPDGWTKKVRPIFPLAFHLLT